MNPPELAKVRPKAQTALPNEGAKRPTLVEIDLAKILDDIELDLQKDDPKFKEEKEKKPVKTLPKAKSENFFMHGDNMPRNSFLKKFNFYKEYHDRHLQ